MMKSKSKTKYIHRLIIQLIRSASYLTPSRNKIKQVEVKVIRMPRIIERTVR